MLAFTTLTATDTAWGHCIYYRELAYTLPKSLSCSPVAEWTLVAPRSVDMGMVFYSSGAYDYLHRASSQAKAVVIESRNHDRDEFTQTADSIFLRYELGSC